MNPAEFVAKWRPVELRERQACHEHFLDLCRLVGHPTPVEMDPHGERFCFERGASKASGGEGWADVWKRGYFGWEYKGKRKDLDAAYTQLNDYREALENPPLLVVCDLDRIEVHTNFTGTAPAVHQLTFEALATPEGMRTLRAVFFDPNTLRPTAQRVDITRQVAGTVGELAQALRDRGVEPHATARFLDRLVFCMFAEDTGLLPKGIFSRALAASRHDPGRFTAMLRQLFPAMTAGGFYGSEEIRRFNGNLFADAEVVELLPDEIALLDAAARTEWSDVEPAIFGTLFERGLDPGKRAQIGAHYTSRADIETLVEPVVMQPLRRELDELRTLVINLMATGSKRPPKTASADPVLDPHFVGAGLAPARDPDTQTAPADHQARPTESPTKLSPAAARKARLEAEILVRNFLDRLAVVRVLDPACGSGNFLYVTLGKLLDLEREVMSFAAAHGISGFFPRVDPRQLHGIEVNPYAFELAQMTVWIGYLQWMAQHGAPWPADPVLKPLSTFECKDAILDLTDPERPTEPDWPAVDYIVSNPPFLGGKLLRSGLGDGYVDGLFALWHDRVPREADLCCYWFEKARAHVEARRCDRAGLLATQGIRGGANRKVLERIKQSGDIFFAESDRPWVLDGANVHVSMVGFDDGRDDSRVLNGQRVSAVFPNLSSGSADTTLAGRLLENRRLCFIGTTKKAPLEITFAEAQQLLAESNPNGRPNSDVVVPWMNGDDLTRRSKGLWIVDFPLDLSLEAASAFQAPFELVKQRVLPLRTNHREPVQRNFWWRLARPAPDVKSAMAASTRVIVSAVLSKHRLFAWQRVPVNPDHQLVVIARSDDYFFGVLHSRVHEVWALRLGTRLETRPRYTPTTCFETFPFPWPPGQEPTATTSVPLASASRGAAALGRADGGAEAQAPAPPGEATGSPDPRVQAIAEAARELDALRERWLNPPEWTHEEVLSFPGSVDGPWARFVHDPDERGIGTVRWPRLVARDADCAATLKTRTLTNLYNQRPTWLALAHERLDAAVFAAYGWEASMSDERLLESLLALNLARAPRQEPRA